jgi:hypothetical protein
LVLEFLSSRHYRLAIQSHMMVPGLPALKSKIRDPKP